MKQKGVFVIKIYDQQYGTWQGSLTGLSDDKTKNFRSMLEMIKMINEELERQNKSSSKGQNYD